MRLEPLFAIAVLLLPLPALAHHGWGSYEADKPMTLEAANEAGI